jgi:hypothetical protein
MMLRKAWLCGASGPGVAADVTFLRELLASGLHEDHRFEVVVGSPTPETLLGEILPDVGTWVGGGNLALLYIAGEGGEPGLLLEGVRAQAEDASGTLLLLDSGEARDSEQPTLPDNVVLFGSTRAFARGLLGEGQRGDGEVNLGTVCAAAGVQPPGPHAGLILNRVLPHAGPILRKHVASAGLGPLWPWVLVDDAVLQSEEPADAAVARFFNGAQPGWHLASDRRVPMLPLGVRILEAIEQGTDAVSFDLFVAPPGEGKTTLLLQIAADLSARDDIDVLWLADTDSFDVEQILSHLATAPRTVLVLDQVDAHVMELHSLLRDLRRLRGSRARLHILGAAQSHRWQKAQGDAFGFRSVCDRLSEVDHVELSPSAARTLVDAWQAVGARGEDAAELAETLLSEVRRARVAGRGLFAALLRLRFPGRAVNEHVSELLPTLAELGEEVADAFVGIALVDALGVPGVDLRVLAEALGVSRDHVAGFVLDSLVGQAAITSVGVGGSSVLRTRHSTIARAVLRDQALQGNGERLVELAGLLVAGAVTRDQGDDAPGLAQAAGRVEQRLYPELGPELAARLGLGMAEAAWATDPRLRYLTERLELLQHSGKDEAAVALAEQSWSQLPKLSDHEPGLRGFLLSWGHAELGLDRAQLALALHLAALSDQAPAESIEVPLGPITLKEGLTSLLSVAPATPVASAFEALADLASVGVELRIAEGADAPGVWSPSSLPPSDEEVVKACERAAAGLERWPAPLEAWRPLTFERLRTRYVREIVSRFGPLMAHVPEAADDPDELEFAFLTGCEAMGVEPYPAQEEAFTHVAANRSVLLCTPTGSGKSLVALCAHFVALAKGLPSIYTAPTKALVNEKFFQLCAQFGSRNVGLITGDGAVNREAPVICCTAEILANMAVRQGADAPFAWVVMDEFHYLGDRSRGMAWLLPLLELRNARFLLMSATIGSREELRTRIEEQTGVETVLVESSSRPIPLRFTWRDTTLLESMDEAEARSLTPAYVVCFSKREAWNLALSMAQRTVPDPDGSRAQRRKEVREHLDARKVRFVGTSGKELRRCLLKGVAPHHGGMLPRYRRLVEQLVVQGLVSIVTGTDTLGVGVNMPIRAVIFTQLYKYDGSNSRHLQAREFLQIAGRAGRKGFDDVGHVWAQAPEHLMVNRLERAKAQAAGKLKKFRAKQQPREFKGWDEQHFKGIRRKEPGPLRVPFRITAELVLGFLGRTDGSVDALRTFVERAKLSQDLTQKALDEIDALIEQLQPAHLQRVDEGWRVVGAGDARSMERPLGRFLGDALVHLDEHDPDFPVRLISLLESVLDNPEAILRAQIRGRKNLLYGALKRARRDDNTEEEGRLEDEIAELTHEQPEKEFIDAYWAIWSEANPWFRGRPPSPKSVLRALFESGATFDEFVSEFELVNEEGRLLYYLSDAYRVLTREAPAWVGGHEEVAALIEWLDVLVHTVDSSLVHEWERFEDPDLAEAVSEPEPPPPPDVTTRPAAFRRLVRNASFRWIQDLGRRNMPKPSEVSAQDVRVSMEAYFQEHGPLRADMNARGPQYFWFEGDTVRQTLADPEDDRDWIAEGRVDWPASKEQGRAVLVLTSLGRVGG